MPQLKQLIVIMYLLITFFYHAFKNKITNFTYLFKIILIKNDVIIKQIHIIATEWRKNIVIY